VRGAVLRGLMVAVYILLLIVGAIDASPAAPHRRVHPDRRTPVAAPTPPRSQRSVLTLVDRQGNGRVHFTDLGGIRSRWLRGRADVAMSLSSGLAVSSASLLLPSMAANLSGNGYVELTAQKILGFADMRMQAPLEGAIVEAHLKQDQDVAASSLDGALKVDIPLDLGLPFQTIVFGASASATCRSGAFSMNFAMQGEVIKKYVSINRAHVKIRPPGLSSKSGDEAEEKKTPAAEKTPTAERPGGGAADE